MKQDFMCVYILPPILQRLDPCLSCSSGLNCIHSWDDRFPRYWYCLLLFLYVSYGIKSVVFKTKAFKILLKTIFIFDVMISNGKLLNEEL